MNHALRHTLILESEQRASDERIERKGSCATNRSNNCERERKIQQKKTFSTIYIGSVGKKGNRFLDAIAELEDKHIIHIYKSRAERKKMAPSIGIIVIASHLADCISVFVQQMRTS